MHVSGPQNQANPLNLGQSTMYPHLNAHNSEYQGKGGARGATTGLCQTKGSTESPLALLGHTFHEPSSTTSMISVLAGPMESFLQKPSLGPCIRSEGCDLHSSTYSRSNHTSHFCSSSKFSGEYALYRANHKFLGPSGEVGIDLVYASPFVRLSVIQRNYHLYIVSWFKCYCYLGSHVFLVQLIPFQLTGWQLFKLVDFLLDLVDLTSKTSLKTSGKEGCKLLDRPTSRCLLFERNNQTGWQNLDPPRTEVSPL